MRLAAVTLILALASNIVLAQEAGCGMLAERLQAAYSDFPEVILGTEVELFTWRASCAETPPDGPGNIAALCEMDTTDGGAVFYWLKSQDGGQSSGFQMCVH